MKKLIVGLDADTALLKTAKETGWDGVFFDWNDQPDYCAVKKETCALGLEIQSIHAPFTGIYRVWEGTDEEAKAEMEKQLTCFRDAAGIGVDLVIMHAIIGLDRVGPNEIGVERFFKMIREAEKLGVRIALENTEGEEYLKALMDAFKDEKNVGFCVDTGHELCYNHGTDTIAKYGRRLFGTHLNDNMGQTGEKITWYDDAHLLPFDGVADWVGIAARLKKAGFTGPLTFELIKGNRPERHTSDRYIAMTDREYLAAAYEHARCFENLMR